MDNEVIIEQKESEKFNLIISFKNLTWDNLRRFDFALSEYLKAEKEGLNNWSEKEKAQWHVLDRQHPVIEMRELMKNELIKISPSVVEYL